MALNKGDLMKLTDNDRGVDSALPQPWLDKMSREMLIDYDSARFWYAYSYKNNYFVKTWKKLSTMRFNIF